MVEQAEKLARLAPVDREYTPTLGKQTYKPTGGYVEATANLAVDDRARAIGGIIDRFEKSKVIGAGFHSVRAQAGASATKNGNFDFERSTNVSLSITARTPDGTSSGYFQRSHFDIGKLDTARIEPQAVVDLLGGLAFGFNARSAEEGRSAFSAPEGKTRLGETLFDEKINIYSDPWNGVVPGSQSAQDGIPAQKIYLVRNGKVENLIYNRFWAKQKGKEPTPGPVNMIMDASGPTSDIEAMIKSTKSGVLVSRFWYIRSTDPRTASSTGLTRDGVWMIEDGKIAYPVKNLRFNQSMIKMLAPGNVLMVGRSERVGGGSGSLLPPLKLAAFTFTSQSEAV
jgi:hypothetical protein